MSFDWRTEDDGDWDETEFVSPEPAREKPARKQRRVGRWLLPGLLMVIGLLAAALALNRRVQAVTGQMEADILASYRLVEKATAQQDEDLLHTVLSGRDEAWLKMMIDGVAGGELTDRSGLGLRSLPATAPLTPTIAIQPDLLAAEVTTVLPYAIEIGNGLMAKVELEQTAVYRLGTNRWLLSPPDADFWGSPSQSNGRYLTLLYPARDQEIAHSLLLRLDEKIGELCSQFQDVTCPEGYRFTVELTTDPAALSQLQWPSVLPDANRRQLVLPTPTLVGLPVYESGESALFRGYGRLVATAVLADLWDYDCCQDGVALFLAVIDGRLQQLGLQPRPYAGETAVATVVYDDLLAEGIPPLFANHFLGGLITSDSFWLQKERAEALTAFAQAELALNGQQLVQGLPMLHQSGMTIGSWLRGLSASRLSPREMEAAWHNFVYNHSAAARQTLPAPLPEQDIGLLCYLDGEERIAFYRYDLAQATLQLEQLLNREVSVMAALPDDSGLAVWEAGYSDDLTNLFLWRDGVKTAVANNSGASAPAPVPLRSDPSHTKLLLAPADKGDRQYGLLDVAGCLHGDCALDTLDGYPAWSPDLAHMILLRSETFRAHMAQASGDLLLIDNSGRERETLGVGSSPFWLDAETYGYVTDAGDGQRNAILTGKIGSAERETLLTIAILEKDGVNETLRLIDFVARHPTNPDWLVLVTVDAESDETTFDWFKEAQPGATFFVYDLAAGEVVKAHPFVKNVGFNRSYRFSPNGRFLLLGEGAEFRPTLLHLINTESGEAAALTLQARFLDSIYWYTDFSLDGDWLLVMDKDFIHILYPESPGYDMMIVPHSEPCETAVWVNKKN